MRKKQKSEILRENERLKIEFDLGSGVESANSRIEDFDQVTLKIIAPFQKGIPRPLPRGLKLQAKIPREDALYCFDAYIVDRETGTIPHLVLSTPKKIERVQRRSFYRVDADLAVDLLLSVAGSGGPGPLYEKNHSLDISGGGVRVEGKESLPLDSVLFVKIHLPGRKTPIQAKARVTRVEELGSGRKRRRLISLRFDQISPQDQEAIVQYVFKRNEENRRSE